MILYLDSTATLVLGSYYIEQTVVGLNHLNDVYELQNIRGDTLSIPEAGAVYINPGLSEIYGVNFGDTMIADIAEMEHAFTVADIADIAANAKSASIYINANELSEILKIPADSYNGALSMGEMNGGVSVTKTQRINDLNRNAVSNNISGMDGVLVNAYAEYSVGKINTKIVVGLYQ